MPSEDVPNHHQTRPLGERSASPLNQPVWRPTGHLRLSHSCLAKQSRKHYSRIPSPRDIQWSHQLGLVHQVSDWCTNKGPGRAVASSWRLHQARPICPQRTSSRFLAATLPAYELSTSEVKGILVSKEPPIDEIADLKVKRMIKEISPPGPLFSRDLFGRSIDRDSFR
jgi:hypothetical protein